MKIPAFSLGLLLAAFTIPVYAAPTVVGKISFAKGSNAAQQPNAAPRLLGKDAEVYQGDNIQTSDASFVIVEFSDGSKVTIRPNSNFKIEQFDAASKNAKLTVYEGGVRATTGEFAKAGADNFQVKTPDATLKGQKDSDFSVRVCKEGNCGDKKDAASENSVAKVIAVKGDVFAQNRADKNSNERKLTMGAGLNPQDFLTSQADSHVVMMFKDGERVTLHPNSELDIVKYDFQQPGKKDQILFKLAAGGMRALTGSIGKKDKSAYALDTPVATIGIRGTDNSTVMVMNVDGSVGQVDAVHEGGVSVSNSVGSVNVGAGEFSLTPSSDKAPAIVLESALPGSAIKAIEKEPKPADVKVSNSSTSASSNGGKVVVSTKVSEKSEKSEKSDKAEKSENKSDKSDKSEGNSDKSDKSDKSEGKTNKADSGDKNDSKSSVSATTSDDSNSGGGGSESGSGSDSDSVTLAEGQSMSVDSNGDSQVSDEIPPMLAQDDSMPSPGSIDSANVPSTPLFSPAPGGGGGGACVVK